MIKAEPGSASLSSCSGARPFRPSGTRITDAGLMHLKGLTSLTAVLVGGTSATDEGIDDLKKALPNLRSIEFMAMKRSGGSLGFDSVNRE
jgi:hypothetical protein